MTERTINAERVEQLIDVFGSFDENVRKIEDAFGIKITNRNNELKVTGDEEAADNSVAGEVLNSFLTGCETGADEECHEGADKYKYATPAEFFLFH